MTIPRLKKMEPPGLTRLRIGINGIALTANTRAKLAFGALRAVHKIPDQRMRNNNPLEIRSVFVNNNIRLVLQKVDNVVPETLFIISNQALTVRLGTR